MRKLIFGLLVASAGLCQASGMEAVDRIHAAGPITECSEKTSVRKDGVYQITYDVDIVQKQRTTEHISLGLSVTGKIPRVPCFFLLYPSTYAVERNTKKGTHSHASGTATLKLKKGDKLQIGIVRNNAFLQYPDTTLKNARIELLAKPIKQR